MTQTMIERVARAIDPDIWEIDGPIPTKADTIKFHQRRQYSIAKARAAIEAMRDHTREMDAAGYEACSWDIVKGPDHVDVYRAMIDAALQEKE